MAYFKKVPSGNDGKISYNSGIVNGIVLLAISEIDGVRIANFVPGKNNFNKSIKVNFEKDGSYVDVDVLIDQNASVSDMAFKIQENIKHNVEAMTEYHISKVNVNVCGVMFDEDIAVNNKN